MQASLKRQHSTGNGPSNRKRALQDPCLPDLVPSEQHLDPTHANVPTKDQNMSHFLRLPSAALALCDLDIEVVMFCLSRIKHLNALLDFSDSDIRNSLASAKIARQFRLADHLKITTHILVVTQSLQTSSIPTTLGHHELRAEPGFDTYANSAGLMAPQPTDLADSQYSMPAPYI